MLPQNPPHPSCSYLPLKLASAGIQTSKLITESFVGVAVPATRQNGGSPVFVVQPGAPMVQPGGVLNDPPMTDRAVVITASGNVRFIRPEQLVAAETGLELNSATVSKTADSTPDAKRLIAILP